MSEVKTDTVLTQDLMNAQVGVLGSMLIDDECVGFVLGKVSEKDFVTRQYRSIFQAIKSLFRIGLPIDSITVREKLGGRAGDSWTELLNGIMDYTPTAANVDVYVQMLKEKATLYQIQELGAALQNVGDMNEARFILDKAMQLRVGRPGIHALTFAKGYEEFFDRHSGETAVEHLDWAIFQLNEVLKAELGNIVIIGAYPGDGKTALALQCAARFGWKHNVGYFSFESKSSRLYDRHVAREALISGSAINDNKLTEEDFKTIIDLRDKLAGTKVTLIDAVGMTALDMEPLQQTMYPEDWERRARTAKYRWGARCTCSSCGEDFIAGYVSGKGHRGIVLNVGDDGQVYTGYAEVSDGGTEYLEGEGVQCPFCWCDGILTRRSELRHGRTHQVLQAEVVNVDNYTVVMYWLVSLYLTDVGSESLNILPHDALLVDMEGKLRRFRAERYGNEVTQVVWTPCAKSRDPMQKTYYSWEAEMHRKIGGWTFAYGPELDGHTGEKTALDKYIGAGGCWPGAYLHVWQKHPQVSAHFKVREFACHDGSDTVFVSDALVRVLEQIREHFGKPVHINSGYRTEAYNAATKDAAPYSQHKYGLAADIVIQGVTPAQVAAYAETLLVGTGGIGIYGRFTHVDVRKVKSRWNG